MPAYAINWTTSMTRWGRGLVVALTGVAGMAVIDLIFGWAFSWAVAVLLVAMGILVAFDADKADRSGDHD